MLRDLYDTARAVFNLADVLRENRREIRLLHEQVVALARALERQAFEMARLDQREQYERSQLALEMENRMLRGGGTARGRAGRR